MSEHDSDEWTINLTRDLLFILSFNFCVCVWNFLSFLRTSDETRALLMKVYLQFSRKSHYDVGFCFSFAWLMHIIFQIGVFDWLEFFTLLFGKYIMHDIDSMTQSQMHTQHTSTTSTSKKKSYNIVILII